MLNSCKDELVSMILDGPGAFVFVDEDRCWMCAEEGEASKVRKLEGSVGNNSEVVEVKSDCARKGTGREGTVKSRKISKIKPAKKETRSKLRIKVALSRRLSKELKGKKLVAIVQSCAGKA